MNKTVRVGVIGTGFIGPVHIEAARRTGKAFVAGLVELDAKTAAEKARSLGVPAYYTDYRDLLDNPEIDVVHICSPNRLHYQMARDALLAGKHVVCEKPLTITGEEARELVALVREKNLVGAVHFNMRYYPLARHARSMVEQGEAGEIYALTGSYEQDWLLLDTDYSWRLESKVSGPTRAVGDIGSHWLDLAEYITGLQVDEVMADFATFHKTRKKPKQQTASWENKLRVADNDTDYEEVPIDTEDYAAILLRFTNGAKGMFAVTQMAAGRKNRISYEVNGSKCSLVWDSEKPNEMMIGRRDRANELLFRDPALMHDKARQITTYPGGHNEGFGDTTRHLLDEVYQYILAGDPCAEERFPTFQAGYREVVLCDAILESARKECWVKVGMSDH